MSGTLTRLCEVIVGFSVRQAWLVLGLFIGFSLIVGYFSSKNLKINSSTQDMISAEVPFRRHYDDYIKAFPQYKDVVLVVVDGDNADLAQDAAERLDQKLRENKQDFLEIYRPGADPYFEKNGLLYSSTDDLYALSERLAQAQPLLADLKADPSLRGLFGVLTQALEQKQKGETLPLELDQLFTEMAEVAEAQRQNRYKTLPWQELMSGKNKGDLTSKRRLLMVKIKPDYSGLSPAAKALKAIKKTTEDLELTAKRGVNVRLTGGPALSTEELGSVTRSASEAGILSFILISLMYWRALRSFRMFVVVQANLIIGLVLTTAFALLVIGHLNLISVTFAVLFIGLGGDLGMHICLRFREEIQRGLKRPEALLETGRDTGPSLLICSAAAGIGFLSFAPTDYRGLAELGIISAAGMAIAALICITLVPALLAIIPPKKKHQPLTAPFDWAGKIVRYRSKILLGAGVFAVASLPFALKIEFDVDPLNLNDQSLPSVTTFRELLANPKTSPYAITVLAENVEAGETMAKKLEVIPEVSRVVTLSRYVPKDQEDKLLVLDDMALFLEPVFAAKMKVAPSDADRNQSFSRFVGLLDQMAAQDPLKPLAHRLAGSLTGLGSDNQSLVELERRMVGGFIPRIQQLENALSAGPVKLEDLPESLVKRETAADGRVQVLAFPSKDLSDNQALIEFVRAVQRVAPAATGTPVIVMEAGKTVVGAFFEAGIYSFVGIVVVLLLATRSASKTSMVMGPLILAGLLTAATAQILGISFNFANLIAIPLLLGLGVDSGIHMVMRHHHAGNIEELAQTSTPNAVFYSALTTIGSFGSFGVTQHAGTASMGILLTIAIIFTLLCSLVILPALAAKQKVSVLEQIK